MDSQNKGMNTKIQGNKPMLNLSGFRGEFVVVFVVRKHHFPLYIGKFVFK